MTGSTLSLLLTVLAILFGAQAQSDLKAIQPDFIETQPDHNKAQSDPIAAKFDLTEAKSNFKVPKSKIKVAKSNFAVLNHTEPGECVTFVKLLAANQGFKIKAIQTDIDILEAITKSAMKCWRNPWSFPCLNAAYHVLKLNNKLIGNVLAQVDEERNLINQIQRAVESCFRGSSSPVPVEGSS